MEATEHVYAQVVLKAISGRNATQTTATVDQIDSLRPDNATVARAVAALEQTGFRVGQSGITLSVSGSKQRFESVFGVSLHAYEQDGQTYYRPDKPASIPESMRAVVEAIVWPEPRQYFH